MELDLSSQSEDCYLKKYLFKLKSQRSDGLILQVHHSFTDSVGHSKRYKLIHASFSDSGSNLAVADHKGNIFIINLEVEKYWKLPHVGLLTLISFPVLRKSELLVALDTTDVIILHIESGNIIGVLNGHSVAATEVSYADDGCYYITSCPAEAIVWNSMSFEQIHRLSLKSDVFLKKVIFMPVTNHILACFQDDTMHVWKFNTFECIKQIIPQTWKSHHIKAIAITTNGRSMVIGGQTANLVIFCLDTWIIKKVIEFPESISGIKQIIFIPEPFDGGAHKILALLTTSLEIFFFNIESSVFLKGIHQIFGMTTKIITNSSGKFLASTLTTGEVNVYTIEKILYRQKEFSDFEHYEGLRKTSSNYIISRNQSSYSRRTQKSFESLSSIQKELKETLEIKKLLPILKQFGEYPESYRTLIWKMILQVPRNQECFLSLSSKKCHQSYVNLESKYPLVNKSLLNSLKKLLSNLSYWCPLFGEVDFLPEFAFPFVKMFHTDPLTCFEVVATVIVNWCQNWFEFYPFPPINMLSALENILGYHEPDLLEFYFKNNITSSVSVCPLFHTCFSEVLSKTEWLKLWDHILSNEPSFLFMAIVAYNVVCKNAIKSFQDCDEIEKFFHQQNPIDMKMFITKTYDYLKNTPDEIHCRQFFSPFRPIECGGSYLLFVAYPKLILDPTSEKLQSIRKEEEEILEEQLKAISIKKELDKKLKTDDKAEDRERIYRELEEKIRKTVEAEEDRMLTQRQKLQNLRQELRMKELEILEVTRDKALKEKIRKKEIEFERLLGDISRRKAREKAEVDIIEDEIRKYYSELLLRKCQLEMELSQNGSECHVEKILEEQSQNLEKDLSKLQDEWSSSHHIKKIDISNKVAAIRVLINQLKTEVSKKVAGEELHKNSEKNHEFVKKLKEEVDILESEVEQLLFENLNYLKEKQEKRAVPLCKAPTEKGNKNHKKESSSKPVLAICNSTSSQQKKEKTTGKFKFQRTIKTYSKIKPPGPETSLRKITTIRSRKINPKKSLTNCNDITKDTIFPHEEKQADSVGCPSSEEKYISSRSRPLLKSKFTCADEYHRSFHLNDNKNLTLGKTREDILEKKSSSFCDMDCETVEKQRQPPRDSICKKVNCKQAETKQMEKSSLNKDALSKIGSENDIFKMALTTRKQIINEAKRRHEV